MDTANDFDILKEEDNFAVAPQKAEQIPIPAKELNNPLAVACDHLGVSVNSEQLSILDTFMERAQHGHQAALPMMCKATKCPFLGHCPLAMAKMELPEGKLCPVERSMIVKWVHKTLIALDIDPHDPENAVDMDMAMELAGMELIRYRAACHMADDPALTEERIVGYSPQGQPIYDEKPKINLLILERQAKLIGRLREQLLATRKAQAQVGRVASDVSVKAANMLQKARDLAEKRKSGQEALDATYTVKDERGKQTGL